MRVRTVQALRNTAIVALSAMGAFMVYTLIVGRFDFYIGRTRYDFEDPTELRITALILILVILSLIRVLRRGSKSIG